MCVLDVGCGRGEILRHTARLGAGLSASIMQQSQSRLSRNIAAEEAQEGRKVGVYQASALFSHSKPMSLIASDV